jgi:REP element-mobilizing transposase RayT
MYAVYANPDHVHFLVSINPEISVETLATIIATSTEKFINDNKLINPGKFRWQNSASAFSVSKADVDKVCKYILSQPEHHKKVKFAEEYEQFIKYYQGTLRYNKMK